MKKLIISFFIIGLVTQVNLFGQPQNCNTNTKFDTLLTIKFNPKFDYPPVDPPVPPSTTDDDRYIFWVHGLAGEFDTWDRAPTAVEIGVPAKNFPAYKVKSETPTYSENAMSPVAGSLNRAIRDRSTDPENSIAIGSSQGGLVIRQLDKFYEEGALERQFGGWVTFGTSHGGARVINNIPLVYDLGTEICQELGAGYAADAANIPFNLFGLNDFIADLPNIFCEPLTDFGLNLALGQYAAPITEDYAVGAPALEELNNFSSSKPGVVFYGVEENNSEDLFYRITYSLVNDPNEEDYFEGDEDGEFLTKAGNILMDFMAKVEEHRYDHFINRSLATRALPFNLIGHFIYKDRAKCAKRKMLAWQRGVDYFPNINTNWELIIGARERVNTCECRTVSCDYGDCYYSDWRQDNDALQQGCPRTIDEGPDSWTECRTGTTIGQAVKPSDGVVLMESAMAAGNAGRELTNSNHQQMRNDSNTKDALIELFRGDYIDFFITEER